MIPSEDTIKVQVFLDRLNDITDVFMFCARALAVTMLSQLVMKSLRSKLQAQLPESHEDLSLSMCPFNFSFCIRSFALNIWYYVVATKRGARCECNCYINH